MKLLEPYIVPQMIVEYTVARVARGIIGTLGRYPLLDNTAVQNDWFLGTIIGTILHLCNAE